MKKRIILGIIFILALAITVAVIDNSRTVNTLSLKFDYSKLDEIEQFKPEFKPQEFRDTASFNIYCRENPCGDLKQIYCKSYYHHGGREGRGLSKRTYNSSGMSEKQENDLAQSTCQTYFDEFIEIELRRKAGTEQILSVKGNFVVGGK